MSKQQNFQNLSLRPISRIKTVSAHPASKKVCLIQTVPNKSPGSPIHFRPITVCNPPTTNLVNLVPDRSFILDVLNKTLAGNFDVFWRFFCSGMGFQNNAKALKPTINYDQSLL